MTGIRARVAAILEKIGSDIAALKPAVPTREDGDEAEQVDIVKLIGERVNLEPRGKSLIGACPFCSARAFHVRSDKQFFHCFECHESGDAGDFKSRIETRDGI